jgi:hypothetical protein
MNICAHYTAMDQVLVTWVSRMGTPITAKLIARVSKLIFLNAAHLIAAILVLRISCAD